MSRLSGRFDMRGGFNGYRSVHAARMAIIEGRAPMQAPIGIRTRMHWGAHDPVLRPAWTDRLHETLSDLQVDLAPEADHFVHVECVHQAALDIARFFSAGETGEVAPSLPRCALNG
jgi:epoxide hydrolase 4